MCREHQKSRNLKILGLQAATVAGFIVIAVAKTSAIYAM